MANLSTPALKGVILAAGRGSRLGEATRACPKPLMRVGNRTCIDFAIAALMAVVDEVLVVTGYEAAQVEDHIAANWSHARLRTVRNCALESGNLTSLAAARDTIGSSAFIVTNADHLFPPTMYTAHFRPGAGLAIGCERDRAILSDEMKVVEREGRLVEIAKTLTRYDGAYIGTTSIGTDARAAYWRAFDAVLDEADLRTASVEMVLGRAARDARIAVEPRWLTGVRWFEVDTPEDLALARDGLAHREEV
jgi:choline kinase